jgi:hypothetical protein
MSLVRGKLISCIHRRTSQQWHNYCTLQTIQLHYLVWLGSLHHKMFYNGKEITVHVLTGGVHFLSKQLLTPRSAVLKCVLHVGLVLHTAITTLLHVRVYITTIT